MDLIGIEDIRAAQAAIGSVLSQTPLDRSRALEQRVGGPVFLKCENLQRTGSFKIRGAYVRLARLSADERAHGVVAASAGNHAQGVALAAQLLGINAVVFMPVNAPLPKLAATRGYGATIYQVGEELGATLTAAREYAAEHGAVFIHPFDHPDLIAGQGTCGLELAAQCPDARTVIVPTGGGGLLSGVAAAVKAELPGVRVVGVQAAGAAAFVPSLRAGHPVTLSDMLTMADGIAVPTPADITYAHVARLVDEIVTVTEDELSRALLFAIERMKLVSEPAGAAAIAAALSEPKRFEPPIAAVVSGGNIDPLLLMRVIQHGLVAAGRYLSLRCAVPDRPGSLATLVSFVAVQGANVIDVEHSWVSRRLGLGEVDIEMRLETKGPEHAQTVVDALRGAGYRITYDPPT